jgi:hypothetical protein
MLRVNELPLKPFVTSAIVLTGFVICLAADLPGHLSYDSVIQLLEGRTARYSGWHPPVMSWLLGLFDAITPGTALFVVFDATLFFGSLLALVWLRGTKSWAAAVVAALITASPIALIYQGIVWKDVLFADTMVAGFVALAAAAVFWSRERVRYALLALALLLLVLATMARQNGILALFAAVIALGWIAAHHTPVARWRAALVTGGLALIFALAVLSIGNVALGWRIVAESGAAKQLRLLELYDTIGMVKADPSLTLPILADEQPDLAQEVLTDGLRLYNPERNDPLAASQRLSADLNDEDTFAPVRAQWLNLIVHHPWTYLKVRAEVFRWIFATPDIEVCLPYLVGISGPEQQMQQLGIAERQDARDDALAAYADRFIQTPVLSHVFYAVLSLVVLILLFRRRRAEDIAIAALQAGALLFTASFFVIGIACDYRYCYALDIAALVGVFYVALDYASCFSPRVKAPTGI